jgi:hypothetical protein
MISATEELALREWVKVPNISGLFATSFLVGITASKRYEAGGENAPRARPIARLQGDDTVNGSPACSV